MARNLSAIAIALLLATGAGPALPVTPDSRHAEAVTAAREGRSDEALATLSFLVEAHPDEPRYLYDYVVVLGWAGRDEAALELLANLDPDRAPAYVLEGLSKSARNRGRYPLAIALLETAVRHNPDRVECRIGLSLALADAGQPLAADRVLDELPAPRQSEIDALAARAYVAEARGDYFRALALYQSILEREPAHPTALRGRLLLSSRVGAGRLAAELAAKTPGVLHRGEIEALGAEDIAAQVRWGAISAAQGQGPRRFDETDRALAATDALAARWRAEDGELSAAQRTLLFDRLVALRNRYRMADAVELYHSLAAAGITVPAYARLAIADAHLHLEQPEAARDLYRLVLAEQPANFEASLGLFYALVESEDHEAAARQIEHLAATTPKLIHAYSPLMARPNPEYQTALAARAMAPAYADQLAHAEADTARLITEAPFSMPLRENAASIAGIRGWPRRADRDLRWILGAEPDNGIADAERVAPLLAIYDFGDAEAALGHGLRVAAEDKRVQVAEDLWKVHNLRELYVDAVFGRSSGGSPLGTRDHGIDAWLYSQPLGYNWRAFTHGYFSSATFTDGVTDWQRLGGGAEYRTRDLRLAGEVNAGLAGGGAVGVAATGQWWADDHLSVSMGARTQSNLIPLQARNAGVGGWSAEAAVAYRVNESRSFGATAGVLDFTDGNFRTVLGATWFERLVTGPVYKLDATIGIYASANSLENAPYFNPSRDFTPSVTLANDWLTWRRYTQSFRQRLTVTIGAYWQEGFGTGGLWGAQYEHVWEFHRRLYLRYGIGRLARPYDGQRETRDYALVTLDWRF